MSKAKKPPLGIIPHYLWKEGVSDLISDAGGVSPGRLETILSDRVNELRAAISRNGLKPGGKINLELIRELVALTTKTPRRCGCEN